MRILKKLSSRKDFDEFISFCDYDAGVPIDQKSSFLKSMRKREFNRVQKLLDSFFAVVTLYRGEIVVFFERARLIV